MSLKSENLIIRELDCSRCCVGVACSYEGFRHLRAASYIQSHAIITKITLGDCGYNIILMNIKDREEWINFYLEKYKESDEFKKAPSEFGVHDILLQLNKEKLEKYYDSQKIKPILPVPKELPKGKIKKVYQISFRVICAFYIIGALSFFGIHENQNKDDIFNGGKVSLKSIIWPYYVFFYNTPKVYDMKKEAEKCFTLIQKYSTKIEEDTIELDNEISLFKIELKNYPKFFIDSLKKGAFYYVERDAEIYPEIIFYIDRTLHGDTKKFVSSNSVRNISIILIENYQYNDTISYNQMINNSFPTNKALKNLNIGLEISRYDSTLFNRTGQMTEWETECENKIFKGL